MRSIAAAAALGLAVRVALTLAAAPVVPAVSDASTYHGLALVIAHGHGFVNPYLWASFHRSVATAQFPPLWPAFLAVPTRLGVATVTGQRLFACVVGSVTIVLAGLIGRRVAGPAAGTAAAFIAAVDPLLAGSDASLMSETLATALVTGAVLLALRLVDRQSPARWAALGAVIGAAALTRGEDLALLVVLPLPLVVMDRRRWAGPAIAAAVTMLVLAPWLARNAATFHHVIPVADDSGSALAGANCPPAYGGSQTGLWLLACDYRIPTPGLDEAAADARYRQAGIDYARRHAASLPRVVAVRMLRTWGLYHPAQQVDYEVLEGRVHAAQTGAEWLGWVLLILAVPGCSALRRRPAVAWMLLAPTVLAVVVVAATYGNERFRQPAEPALIVVAVVGVMQVRSWVQARAAGRRTPPPR